MQKQNARSLGISIVAASTIIAVGLILGGPRWTADQHDGHDHPGNDHAGHDH